MRGFTPAIVNWLNDIVVAGQGNGLAYYYPNASFTNTQWMLCWIPSLRAEVVLCHIVVTEPAPLPPRLPVLRRGAAPPQRAAPREEKRRKEKTDNEL